MLNEIWTVQQGLAEFRVWPSPSAEGPNGHDTMPCFPPLPHLYNSVWSTLQVFIFSPVNLCTITSVPVLKMLTIYSPYLTCSIPTSISLECGRKLKDLEETHTKYKVGLTWRWWETCKLYTHKCPGWDSNPGPNGRCANHWAAWYSKKLWHF